ncbi:aldehyde dehydrogenase family protein [Nonomuraea sp. NPDC052634]|uniref:aldehyde dehydrogenase family protein n=1 Tax=Nonomuraea sp. NPDC052634 TaxID=3155813 RepID=UPI003448EB0A
MPDYRNLIGGELVPAPRTMETVNPATGEPWARIPASGPAEAAAAAEAASRAFPSWSALPALARAHYLRKVSELFGRHAEEPARLETRDNGRILRDTLTKDLPGMAHLWQIAAGQCLDAVKGDTVQLGPDALGLTRCEPYGVAVCIIPWNSPISTFSAKAAYALAAGNTVVVKPAEQASASVLRLGELLAEVLPPGVLNIVSGLGEEVGDPLDLATTMGPIVSAGQYERVTSYLEPAGKEGARLVFGGRAGAEVVPELPGGYWVAPTLYTTEDNGLRVCQEEIFGPVAVAIPFETDDEALAIANDSRYGLAAGVWTRDLRRAHRFVRDLRTGTVWVNTFRQMPPGLPFGGVEDSGYGHDAVLEYTREKAHHPDLVVSVG